MPESPAEETLGYVLLGVFFSLWLSGILSFQTWNFYASYPNERKWLKAFVGILVSVDGMQTIMGVAIIWDILIKDFNNMSAVRKPTRHPVFVGLISSSVQIFFAWRIKTLSTNPILIALIVVLAIPQLAGGIAYTALTAKTEYFAEFWNFNGVIIGWIASSMVSDIVITTTLTMILRKHSANQDLGAAADLVHKIKIIYISRKLTTNVFLITLVGIHNGLVTVLWSLALLIALVAAKHGAHYMFLYPLGGVLLIMGKSSRHEDFNHVSWMSLTTIPVATNLAGFKPHAIRQ
ncbi:hypothetical protein BDM02DRAFT_3130354 [Thelephora ganbajun]|uniref:Uncharacterized protein n=1 Tax=Thelephora ganbajun TaxID=370292 RepID=A0ACB6ZA32_THEGA|nr:hypothetical protein BDM02DRAFT_3130354 [Thelephora ganbajun]